ncbi:Rhs element Vgr protein [Cupriavidus necator]|uniref:Two domain protein VgrG n=1 Tax=Cupriavidus necator (strain ATCC 17699 / DSM 428 / KCTC 22496 / NCIMB 10442 / H16 / Stanier 337) TaxID=381666 RepID=Q0K9J8_CUPNH|nr:type VI secretion system Vgr family protein [Cupriavidus necator]QCC01128.1 type VI secretion system tip protein VgrG [Cupriavidus necator H16]QQB76046.1 type VI secretion system tip protein VgrG [Cupriavidus necator]WKA39511.1 type VI secretion system tip protein TssI/VgrG [Cupriavidus necator]CAJ93323.1 two domain protein VgrG [Cupriavidus necator H16]
MGSRLRFSFRTVTVSGDGLPELLGQPLLLFSKLSGTESINSLFEYELELKTPDERNVLYGPAGDFDMEAMQGKELTVSIELDGSGTGPDGGFGSGKREITGLVTDVRGPYYEHERILYRLTLRPWLWLATLTSTIRPYQNMTVLEIVEAVLSKYTFPVERRLLDSQYPKRRFQMQAGETDYQFVRRLLAEWGVNFHWEHSDGHHRMVLTDGNGAFRNIPSPAYHAISWYPSSDRADEEHLHEFEVRDRLVSGAWAQGDYDHNQPRADLNVCAADPRDTSHATYELYHWPGDYAEPKSGNDARKEGEMLARINMERLRQHGVRTRGKGNVRAMASGHTFTLKRFLRTKANCEYLIFATRLLIEDVGEFAGSGQSWRCEVEFEAQPTSEIFRPELVEKPYIGGHHKARVVGPANQEIWCDDLGRVRCQFVWDRYGSYDENSSCWIRVTGFSSGDRFGNTHLPRIGQEVIVSYEGGDPDRPIIMGPVNNRLNLPPWDLPSQHALSGYQSKELFGEGRNHTLYDDTQGQQQVQVASDHQNSLLALGHNVRVNDWEGRKDKRGEGFELRTDAHGALRAALGMLITTFSRRNAEGNMMNVSDVIQLMQKALDIASTMGDKATEAQAQDGEQRDIARLLEKQFEQIQGGGELKEFTAPHLVSASPAGIVSTAAGSTHIASGTHTALTTGEHLSVTTGGGFFASIRKALCLFVYEAGMKLVANMGDIDLQALKNNINLLAKLEINATAGKISLKAKEVLLDGGGSYIKLNEGGIENGTNGGWIVHAASKNLTGPSSLPVELKARQVCLECLLKAAARNAAVVPR